MANQDYVKKVAISRYNKIPFIIAMIDSNGTLRTIPFPPQEGELPREKVYGIELMINPSSLTSNLSKIISRQQTMTAFVEDHWGEELDTISFQGFTAAFVTGGPDIYSTKLSQGSTTNQYLLGSSQGSIERARLYKDIFGISYGEGMGIKDTDIGLTVSKRRQSVSYRMFKRLIDIIRINGCMYDTFGRISKRYYIMLSYGSTAYKGFFENIDVTETATDPFRFQYTITFKAEETLYSYVNKGSVLQTLSNF